MAEQTAARAGEGTQADPVRYRINYPAVIHEILDDELVVVDLKSGAYFSLDRIGAQVWERIDAHVSPAEITADLETRYAAEAGVIERAVHEFIAQLARENLITADDGAAPASGNGVPSTPADERAAFSPPLLQKYTDMQDLLLLDPIHEVDETGWPHRKT